MGTRTAEKAAVKMRWNTDEDEQGLPEPDIKEYILDVLFGVLVTTAASKSTVHRLYAMVERKAAHLRLACAVSESEAHLYGCDNLKQHLSKCVENDNPVENDRAKLAESERFWPRSVRIARPRNQRTARLPWINLNYTRSFFTTSQRERDREKNERGKFKVQKYLISKQAGPKQPPITCSPNLLSPLRRR